MKNDKSVFSEIKGLGDTGRVVADNIKRIRSQKKLSYAELSRRLDATGRKIAELGLRRIESRARKVDVDDLTALAVALKVSVIDLLVPGPDALAALSGVNLDYIDRNDLIHWLKGEVKSLSPDDLQAHWIRRKQNHVMEVEALVKSKKIYEGDNVVEVINHNLEIEKRWVEYCEQRIKQLEQITNKSLRVIGYNPGQPTSLTDLGLDPNGT